MGTEDNTIIKEIIDSFTLTFKDSTVDLYQEIANKLNITRKEAKKKCLLLGYSIPAEKSKDNFGLLPIKAEGKAAHPDAYGIGYDNGYKFGSDERYLKQLKAYAKWHGVEETKKEICSRPHLLEKL